MISRAETLLQRKFAELLDWERSKRREATLLAALSYALVVSLLLLPARALLPPWLSPFYVPLLSFFLLAGGMFLRRPWGEKESLRALFRLDRTLRLDERAITAAEILRRGDAIPVERHVLSEAAEKLAAVDVKGLLKRRWSWQARLAPCLLLLWLALIGFDFGKDGKYLGAGALKPASLAEKLKEFSEEMRKKAEAHGLAESLKVAEALRALAEERLRGKGNDEKLGENLAAMEKQIEQRAARNASDFALSAYGRDALASLKAELEAMKGQSRPAPAATGRDLEKYLMERLAALPHLSDAMKQGGWPMGEMGAQELQGLLDKLERDVTGELDQRALADAQDFLSRLLRAGGDGEAPTEAAAARGRAGEKRPPQNDRAGGQGDLAGDQPGAENRRAQNPPGGASAAKQLHGILSEGQSSGFNWRGAGKAGPSKISEQEVAASYRRQVEEDLASEKIPPPLKETVKKYFLSLGMTEEKDRQ